MTPGTESGKLGSSFKSKDEPLKAKNILTGVRHGLEVLGSLLETGSQGMNVKKNKKKNAVHHS